MMALPYVERIVEFITSKEGGMAILLVVDKDKGTPHRKFEKLTHISRGTVSARLKEAKKYGLMKETQALGDHGNVTRYKLTEEGEVYRAALESLELDNDYQRFLEIQETMDRKREVLEKWIIEQNEFGTDLSDSWSEPDQRWDLPGFPENLKRHVQQIEQEKEDTDENDSASENI